MVVGEERTATRFANILDNAANAHGAVELLLQIVGKLGVRKAEDVRPTAEGMLDEMLYLAQSVMVNVSFIEFV